MADGQKARNQVYVLPKARYPSTCLSSFCQREDRPRSLEGDIAPPAEMTSYMGFDSPGIIAPLTRLAFQREHEEYQSLSQNNHKSIGPFIAILNLSH